MEEIDITLKCFQITCSGFYTVHIRPEHVYAGHVYAEIVIL